MQGARLRPSVRSAGRTKQHGAAPYSDHRKGGIANLGCIAPIGLLSDPLVHMSWDPKIPMIDWQVANSCLSLELQLHTMALLDEAQLSGLV